MADKDLRLWMASRSVFPQTATETTHALDANTDAYAALMNLENGHGNVTKIHINVQSITGTSPSYRVALESQADGQTADGTVLGVGNSAKKDGLLVADANALTLDTAYPPTSDSQPVAVTVRYESGTVDASNFALLNAGITLHSAPNYPFFTLITAGTPAVGSGAPFVSLEYADGYIQPAGQWAAAGTTVPSTTVSWASSSNPLYHGNAWVPDFNAEIDAIETCLTLSGTADCNLKIFEDGVLKRTVAIDANRNWRTTTSGWAIYPFTKLEITATKTYWFLIEPTTANNVTIIYPNLISLNAIKSLAGLLYGMTATSGLSPTYYNSGTFRVYPIWPRVYTADFGAGGSVLFNPGLTGNIG